MSIGIVQGLLFLSGLLAFGAVVFWAVTNDAPGSGGAGGGLFAMHGAADDGKKERAARKIRWRRNRRPRQGEED
jgi:hypothetical protein